MRLACTDSVRSSEGLLVQVIAALVPPRDVIDDALGAVAAVLETERVPDDTPAETLPAQRWPRFRTRQPPPQVTVAPTLHVELLDAAHVSVPLVKFGNLASTEVPGLVAALRGAAPDWPALRLRLLGSAPQGWPEDRRLWMRVAGDAGAVDEITKSIARIAQSRQLYVDRRVFRSRVEVGVIEQESGADLARLASALADVEGAEWQQRSVSMLAPTDPGLSGSAFRTLDEVEVGPARPS
jgi:hypothetical protein